MTARKPFDPSAGVWVAFHTWTRAHDGVDRKSYLRRISVDGIVSWTVNPDDALRFDTKAEAVEIVQQLVGRRRGQTRGAERATTPNRPGADR